jgi:hypothetical protein
MRITFKEQPTDPVYPIMHGTSPTAKEFNKRQALLWETGNFDKYDYEQVTTVLLEIFAADYDRRHASRRKPKSN